MATDGDDDRKPAAAAVDDPVIQESGSPGQSNDDRRARAIAMLASGRSIREVTKAVGASRNTIRGWARAEPVAALLRAAANERANAGSGSPPRGSGSAPEARTASSAAETESATTADLDPADPVALAIAVLRDVVRDPSASPAVRATCARRLLDERDREAKRRHRGKVAWANVDPRVDAEGVSVDVLQGLSIGLWEAASADLTDEQREAQVRSVHGHDMSPEQAQAFVDAIDERSLPPSIVERLLSCGLREASDLVQVEIDRLARDCASSARQPPERAAAPRTDA